jgi:hypothetical protein
MTKRIAREFFASRIRHSFLNRHSSFVIILRTLRDGKDGYLPLGGTQAGGHFRSLFGMINPNENNLTRDEPLPTPVQPGEQQIGSGGREQFRHATSKFSTAVSHTWGETKERASRARERTEYFVRENPVPTILGALGLGIAIGLAIRFASTSEERVKVEAKSPLSDLDWSVLSLPLFKSAREKYERSAEAMKDGVKRLKKIDVDRYAKPIRKRWKAWTR